MSILLRVYFKYDRRLLTEFCHCARESLEIFFVPCLASRTEFHLCFETGPKFEDNLIFSLYSTSLFKFDNPSPQGLYKKLANNKNRYGRIWKARRNPSISSWVLVGWLFDLSAIASPARHRELRRGGRVRRGGRDRSKMVSYQLCRGVEISRN